MTIPESQLTTWANLGALAASETTYTSIKTALDRHSWPAGMRYEVYLQGSYRNWTNTRGDSDVDVVTEMTSNVRFDVSALQPGEAAAVTRTYTPETYTFEAFRDQVQHALDNYYGYLNVHNEDKCFHVDAGSGRLGADVVACQSLHRFLPGGRRVDGITFSPRSSLIPVIGYEDPWIENFPKVHYANGVAKHAATREYFKPMVRIWKNARAKVNESRLWSLHAPSYFIECMLYNAPNGLFGVSYQATFKNLVEWLSAVLPTAVGENFTCQNEQLALFGNRPEQWKRNEAIELVNAMKTLWNNWNNTNDGLLSGF